MYGLPILRANKTQLSSPKYCYDDDGNIIDPPCGSVVKIATPIAEMVGNHFTCGVAQDWRNIIAWGTMTFNDGRGNYWLNPLGVKDGASSNTPAKSNIIRETDPVTKELEKSRIIKLRCSTINTFFLTDRGYLYACGNSNHGVFNSAVASEKNNEFSLVTDNVKSFDICSPDRYANGNQYILILKKDGKVYGLGNGCNAFGTGSTGQGSFYSLKDLGLTKITKVFCTNPDNLGKSFAIDEDGYVWATGYNTHGCLGINSTESNVYTWSKVQKQDVRNGAISDLTNVKSVITTNWVDAAGAAGYSGRGISGSSYMSTYFLTNDGFIYTTGNNSFGQLGLGLSLTSTVNVAQRTSIRNASKIATSFGGYSIMVATTTNELYSWGDNAWGQLGHGNTTDLSSPTKIATSPSELVVDINGGGMYGIINGLFVVLTNIGNVYGCGYNATAALGVGQGNVTTLTKNPYFGPNPTQYIDPSNTSTRHIIIGVDLCGYGTEMAQKAVGSDGTLYMSGWNQDLGGIKNFNGNEGDVVATPTPNKLV